MKKIFTLLLLLFCFFIFGQNAFKSADGWGSGWNTNDFFDFQIQNSVGWVFQNTSGQGLRYFRFYSQTANCNTEWGPATDQMMSFGQEYNLTQGSTFAYYVNVTNVTNHYIFKTHDFDACSNPKAVVFEVQGAVRSVSNVSRSANSPLSSDVIITANLDGAFNVGQAVYLRYTKDNFATSTVIKMNGSGTTYSSVIPGSFNTLGANVNYYVFTSGETNVATNGSNADFYTINLQNNSGANYSYTISDSTTWNGTQWDNGEPTAYVDAIIYDNAVLDVSGVMVSDKLMVYNGATLNIMDGGSWTTNGDVENYSSIIVLNGGNFIQNTGDYSQLSTGTFTVRKTTTAAANEYVFWSSPVAGKNMRKIYPAGDSDFVMTYNSNTDYYNTIAVGSSSETGIAGVGYSVKVPSQSTPATFTGVPHNGDITLLIDNDPTDNTNGNTWNLIGNPYPSNLNLVDLYNNETNGIGSSIYFWDNIAATNTTQIQAATTWAIFNASGTTGTWDSQGGTGMAAIIPDGSTSVEPGQAFIVSGLATGNGSITFNNNMRNADVAAFVNKTTTGQGKYWLEMTTPAGFHHSIAITYGEGAQNTYEAFDSKKMNIGTNALYSYGDNNKYGIQGRDYFVNTDVVTLGNKHSVAGQYTITLSGKTGIFANGQPIYLKDKELGIYTDLHQGSYAFTTGALEQQNRFEIVYLQQNSLGTSEVAKEEFGVFKKDNIFVAYSEEKLLSLEIYDAVGRLLVKMQPDARKVTLPALEKGMYTVKGVTAKEVFTQKIIK